MLGQAQVNGRLNPEQGRSSEAVLPLVQDSLDRMGLRWWLQQSQSLPWTLTRGALGVQKGYAHDGTATLRWGYSDALTNASNIKSEVNIYEMPTYIWVTQLPVNTRSRQDRRLPLAMVNPRLAWRPG